MYVTKRVSMSICQLCVYECMYECVGDPKSVSRVLRYEASEGVHPCPERSEKVFTGGQDAGLGSKISGVPGLSQTSSGEKWSCA